MTTNTSPQALQDLTTRWMGEIDAACKGENKKWIERAEKITRRYREEREFDYTGGLNQPRFNLFWSNVQTLAPATYSRRPKVEVTRRFRDSDPVGRIAALILERALQYEIDCKDDLHETMESVVLDRLIPGRGTAWIRYEPRFDSQPAPPAEEGGEPQTVEVLSDEHTPVDYVYWKDFLWGTARTWKTLPWCGRKTYLQKDALEKRFAESAKKFGANLSAVSYDCRPDTSDGDKKRREPDSEGEKNYALVYEIWDRESRQVLWFTKGLPVPLDIKNDIFDLDDFWPCPKPLLATTTNDKLTPVADFVFYQEQLRELDNLTIRIGKLTEALKLVGVYDRSQAALQSVLRPGTDNVMVPVDSWAAFAERGGLKGSVEFLPMDDVARVLKELYAAREGIKQLIYEITGMSDIVRGVSAASETLGAQEIKAKFANLRLSSRQQQVARFVTDVLRIKADIMCKLYAPETLLRISSIQLLPEAKTSPNFQQTVQEAIALLKDKGTRQYRIEVLSASMIELDEVDERQRRNDFMSSLSNFMNGMKNLTTFAPEMTLPALEMLKFVVRGFSVGKSMENSIEEAADAIRQRMANPQPQPPNPDLVLKKEIEQLKQEGENARTALVEDTKKDIAELKAATDLTIKNIDAKMTEVSNQLTSISSEMDRQQQMELQRAGQMGKLEQALMTQAAKPPAGPTGPDPQVLEMLQSVKGLTEAMSRPRKRVPKYDEQGNIISVTEVPEA